MKTKVVNIAGKDVTLAYCYATEIAYKDISGEDILDYIKEARADLLDKRMPDVKKSIFAVIAAAMAYSNSVKEDVAISDTYLMNEATPEELGSALGAVLALCTQFYQLPTGEPTDSDIKKEEPEKN